MVGMSGDDELGPAVERTLTGTPVVGVIKDARFVGGVEPREVIDANEPTRVLAGIRRAQTQRFGPRGGRGKSRAVFRESGAVLRGGVQRIYSHCAGAGA
jgi:hypothetical protein